MVETCQETKRGSNRFLLKTGPNLFKKCRRFLKISIRIPARPLSRSRRWWQWDRVSRSSDELAISDKSSRVRARCASRERRRNKRGDLSYGPEFARAHVKDWGRGDVNNDTEAGVDYLIDRGLADPQRLGIMGSSYGAYLRLAL